MTASHFCQVDLCQHLSKVLLSCWGLLLVASCFVMPVALLRLLCPNHSENGGRSRLHTPESCLRFRWVLMNCSSGCQLFQSIKFICCCNLSLPFLLWLGDFRRQQLWRVDSCKADTLASAMLAPNRRTIVVLDQFVLNCNRCCCLCYSCCCSCCCYCRDYSLFSLFIFYALFKFTTSVYNFPILHLTICTSLFILSYFAVFYLYFPIFFTSLFALPSCI